MRSYRNGLRGVTMGKHGNPFAVWDRQFGGQAAQGVSLCTNSIARTDTFKTVVMVV